MDCQFKQSSNMPRGFSLIEVLVYIAVTILVSTATVSTFLSLNKVVERNQADRILAQTASVALDRIVRDIRDADGINVGLSDFTTSPGVLVLNNGPTTTKFSVVDDDLVVEVNGTEVGPLTSSGVKVNKLTFFRYIGSETELIRVDLKLAASSSVASTTRTFYSSAVPRGLYD